MAQKISMGPLQNPAQHMTKEDSRNSKSMLFIVQSLNLPCDAHMITYLLWEFYSNFNCCVLSNLELCQTVRSCWKQSSDASSEMSILFQMFPGGESIFSLLNHYHTLYSRFSWDICYHIIPVWELGGFGIWKEIAIII